MAGFTLGAEEPRTRRRSAPRCCGDLLSTPSPSRRPRVRGDVYAGGMGLAAVCDVPTMAADTAGFCLNEVEARPDASHHQPLCHPGHGRQTAGAGLSPPGAGAAEEDVRARARGPADQLDAKVDEIVAAPSINADARHLQEGWCGTWPAAPSMPTLIAAIARRASPTSAPATKAARHQSLPAKAQSPELARLKSLEKPLDTNAPSQSRQPWRASGLRARSWLTGICRCEYSSGSSCRRPGCCSNAGAGREPLHWCQVLRRQATCLGSIISGTKATLVRIPAGAALAASTCSQRTPGQGLVFDSRPLWAAHGRLKAYVPKRHHACRQQHLPGAFLQPGSAARRPSCRPRCGCRGQHPVRAVPWCCSGARSLVAAIGIVVLGSSWRCCVASSFLDDGADSTPGVRMFPKILIASRGEIACRVAATARRSASAPWPSARMPTPAPESWAACDEAGAHPAATRRATVTCAASASSSAALADRRAGHPPGYGFLRRERGISPRPAPTRASSCSSARRPAIPAMGLKGRVKQLMERPACRWCPATTAPTRDPALLLQREADRIGYPVLIKASAGGGGGMRGDVTRAADFDAALASCQREAHQLRRRRGADREITSQRPRHIEIQVFGDTHWATVCICSSATARCSAATRRCWRKRPPPGLEQRRRRWANRRGGGAKAVGCAKARPRWSSSSDGDATCASSSWR